MVVESKQSGMADVPTKSNLPRKSAFSCEACRKRKVKCNGASPSCSRCATRGEVCVYSLAPTLSYTKQLEARVAQLEDALSKLRNQQPPESVSRKGASPASPGESSASPGIRTRIKEEDENEQELARDFEGLKVEHDGRISFHGPTSLFQLPSGLLNETSSKSRLAMQLEGRKERLINNAWRERAFEQMATMPEPFQYLLDSHWCWIQPLFGFVYRPTFTRDMKVNGPYYTDALLNAILAHSVRWCKLEPKIGPILDSFEGGAQFSHRAVSGLYDSLKAGYVGIPTIQTLLLLSAQEFGRGNRSQAWLYSGMAFRILDDLGINIDSRKYSDSAHLTDEDIELRNRLFWSCYFWDKLISLYFGRSPTMQHSRVSPPRMILDDTAEVELWTPHGVEFPDGTHYPPTQAHSTSCFMKMCGLAEILNQILIHIYDPLRQVSEVEYYNCIQEQAANLADWWEELPDYLKLLPMDLPPYSPPSHIVTLNCLYHTINILLHRPVLCSKSNRESNDKSHLIQCMTSATTILTLFDLYRRTFGDSHVVLSLSYSVYTAASIFLLEIQALKYAAPGTLDKLKYCIYALERVKGTSPVISTALSLIYQELQKLQIDIHIVLPTAQTQQPPQQSQTQPQPQPQPQLQQRTRTHHSHSPSQHQTPPPSNISSNTSQRVSPVQQQPPQADHPITSMHTAGMSSAASMLPGYNYQTPIADFELSQTNMPQVTATHLIGGMPNAMLTLDNPGAYEITPEVFEAFSYAEPITTNMAPTVDYGWDRHT
ncbi:transcriptional regulator family: Fungal Specific TF [Aspergillus niger]|nr:transcriptional regulator family: Fungal Specific TF [Aspergillus niger]KAI2932127.1 transcriptional regulator family: Fungal Specific TF [Aspergillus niger]KAI2961691.1 transcriptional regulator family: Fungal Specific TF [Aspergillus niger]KAI2978497.1 transcriptional regulator family: Fungal Specific TF [Aspergillus niger]KAI2979022.1 transcriptional regulator family: Fungal Specific TF [Aspergillus niger]